MRARVRFIKFYICTNFTPIFDKNKYIKHVININSIKTT